MQYGAMAYARPLAQCIQIIQHIHIYMSLVTLRYLVSSAGHPSFCQSEQSYRCACLTTSHTCAKITSFVLPNHWTWILPEGSAHQHLLENCGICDPTLSSS